MITGLLKMIFGTKNDREIKKIRKTVKKINNLEVFYEELSDEDLKNKTNEFRKKLSEGKTLDDILVDAFAVVREASKRILGMRHYDVQLIGGIVLHHGKITEMKTGEGKTLVATCPVYLNALSGDGVHVITVNDYLASRDKEQMSKLYDFLGLTTGVILNGLDNEARKKAYQCDITYGTNSEFGFDYLRDNMIRSNNDKVQKKLNFCIVDEVDSILIDEARTPLIISGAAADTAKLYETFFKVAGMLERSRETEIITDIKKKKEMNIPNEKWKDYEVDEKARNIVLTEKGVKKVESLLRIDNLYSPETIELTHYLMQSLKAKELFQRDKDYLVKESEVIIIDEFTGRAMEGRRYSDGLHQAIEAKEGVKIAGENQTLASITLQNYFRMYSKLSGMTGTAETEATEFVFIYGLEVIVIPTNKPIARKDNGDIIYKTHKEKIKAITKEIIRLHEKGQPVLVGTITIQGSEMLSKELKNLGIPHNVLNAKFHAKEAEIIAQAGRFGAVTIATNMAGRGTDIMLGGNPEFMAKSEGKTEEEIKSLVVKYKAQCEEEKEKVKEAGGLFILGTERHESRRIDNQLRGRAGRQGDQGESLFFLSLEDDLMKMFGSDRVKSAMDRLGIPEDEPITHRIITRAIENAQKKVEARNFGIRKSLLEFDDVMNKQREAIYHSRNEALSKDDLKETILGMLNDSVNSIVREKFVGEYKDEWDIVGLSEELEKNYEYLINDLDEYKTFSPDEYIKKLVIALTEKYNLKEKNITENLMREIEKYVLLEVVDNRWREHLKSLDGLRESVYLRSYGQKDPIIEYKLISGELYRKMLDTIKKEVTSYMFKVVIKEKQDIENLETIENKDKNKGKTCECGSGKPYEKCCGRINE